MRILLAGGAGFIGSHLASRLLDQGHRVVIIDNLLTGRRSNLARLQAGPRGRLLEVVIGDVCRCRLPAGRFDAVLHLASAASPRDYLRYPLETLQAGSVATHRLLECSHRWKARFLLASTSEVYGDPQVHPQPEDYWGHVNPVGVRAVYDEAKRYAEAVASAYARHHGTRVRIARIFNTYGPGMRPDDGRVIPTLVVQALPGGDRPLLHCRVPRLLAGRMGGGRRLRLLHAVGNARPVAWKGHARRPERDRRLRRRGFHSRLARVLDWSREARSRRPSW